MHQAGQGLALVVERGRRWTNLYPHAVISTDSTRKGVPVSDQHHIVRIARVRIIRGCEAEFDQRFEHLVAPARRGFPGMMRLYRMRSRGSDGVTEYVIQSIWRSAAHLERYKQATGGPPIPDELIDTVESGTVDEYELLEVDDYDLF
jgi:quinol monooxygenase YgiN